MADPDFFFRDSSFRKTNIFDNVVYMMEKYADNLEELVIERTGQLIEEKKKTDALLERMLPRYVHDIYIHHEERHTRLNLPNVLMAK